MNSDTIFMSDIAMYTPGPEATFRDDLTRKVSVVLYKGAAGKRFLAVRFAQDGVFTTNFKEIDQWQSQSNTKDFVFIWADRDDIRNNRYHKLKFEKKSNFKSFVAFTENLVLFGAEEQGGRMLTMIEVVACLRLMNGLEMVDIAGLMLRITVTQAFKRLRDMVNSFM